MEPRISRRWPSLPMRLLALVTMMLAWMAEAAGAGSVISEPVQVRKS